MLRKKGEALLKCVGSMAYPRNFATSALPIPHDDLY